MKILNLVITTEKIITKNEIMSFLSGMFWTLTMIFIYLLINK